MTTPRSIFGWDVGGANIKAARIRAGEPADWKSFPPAIIHRAFPLWREPQGLQRALVEVAQEIGALASPSSMALTMTGELADCFRTKREGVAFIIDAFSAAFPGSTLEVWCVDRRFRPPEAAREEPVLVASANWMASAVFVAPSLGDAVFVDVGSTTTDIVPIAGGRVVAEGRTDPERLAAGELVYTGALRTPVSAIVETVPFSGRECRVAAELFAIAADAHLWLGAIGEGDYTCETPDGRGRSRSEAGARLARMVCADLDMLGPNDIDRIARCVREGQVSRIAAGIRQVRSRPETAGLSKAVLAGEGAFLARMAAENEGLEIRDLAGEIGTPAARSCPAAAVARLLEERDRPRP